MREGAADTLEEWVAAARRLSLAALPSAQSTADANMLVLPVPVSVEAQEIVVALEQVRAEYCRKVREAKRRGLFYVWLDEMSGTVRCSFLDLEKFEDLPFRCQTKQANELAEVAVAVGDGLPGVVSHGDLSDVGWSVPNECEGMVLSVFAQLLS